MRADYGGERNYQPPKKGRSWLASSNVDKMRKNSVRASVSKPTWYRRGQLRGDCAPLKGRANEAPSKGRPSYPERGHKSSKPNPTVRVSRFRKGAAMLGHEGSGRPTPLSSLPPMSSCSAVVPRPPTAEWCSSKRCSSSNRRCPSSERLTAIRGQLATATATGGADDRRSAPTSPSVSPSTSRIASCRRRRLSSAAASPREALVSSVNTGATTAEGAG